MNRRQRERAILRIVYKESEFQSVVQQESPDFVLQRVDTEPFGVEITELFDTESDARTVIHPTYISDLLSGEPPMHRDDAAVLGVSEVTIRGPDGKEKASGVPAIIRPLASVEERAGILAGTVDKKQRKAASYAGGLSHVNLIVMDRSDESWSPESLNIGELLIPDLRDELRRTRFREVFFVTRTRGRGRFYVPLRMVLLVSELYLFGEALISYKRETIERAQLIPMFARFMDSLDFPVQLVSVPGRGHAASMGNAAVAVSSSGDVTILDHADHAPPPKSRLPWSHSTFVEEADFIDHHAGLREESIFVTEIAMDPVQEPPF